MLCVLLIEDRLHDRLRTREEPSLTDPAENRVFHDSPLLETRLNEQTIPNDSSWQTDRRKLNQGKES